jgi:ABC-2 type transport system permease protein/oleandomycin transport system permease protein
VTATIPSAASSGSWSPEASTAEVGEAGQVGLKWLVLDTLTVTKRNLIAYTRIPEAVFFSSVQPIMFVLLFRYVFGGAIRTPGFSYVDFMMPGIFVQTVAFGAMNTALGISEDLQKGLIERFRALPMARSAVLAGRTTSDLVRNVGVVVLLTAIGFAVGFRVGTNAAEYIAGVALILAFAYAISWGAAVIGLAAPNSETAQLMGFPILLPLTFASSAFVPVSSMPGWLQAFASHQPVTVVINAARALMIGRPSSQVASHLFAGGSTATQIWQALAWIGGLLVVLAPLAVNRYRSHT